MSTIENVSNPGRQRVSVSRRPNFLSKVIYGRDIQSMPERVAKGARLLDRKRPNWYAAIDADRLNMAPDADDIVSVLYGDYLAGIVQLDLPAEGPVDHGLTLPQTHANPRMWEHLTRHWQAEIRQRQEA